MMTASFPREGILDHFEEAGRQRQRVVEMGFVHNGIPMSPEHAEYLDLVHRYPSIARAVQEALRSRVSPESRNTPSDTTIQAIVNSPLGTVQRDHHADVRFVLRSVHVRY